MKTRLLRLPLALAALLAGAGCSSASLDLRPESDPARVLNGTVNFRNDQPLPADAEVVVRVLDASGIEQARVAANRNLPVTAHAQVAAGPVTLAEKTVPVGPGQALPFRIEFNASDEVMRHGVNIEARITYGGAVRFRTVSAQVVTLSSVDRNPYEVWVMAVGR
jgi:uncharacterized lipoprotein YbaY